MNQILAVLIMVLYVSCGTTSEDSLVDSGGSGCVSSCPPSQEGYLCDNGCLKPLLAGACDSTILQNNPNCPTSSSHCCVTSDSNTNCNGQVNICVPEQATASSTRIWFVTDLIRSGVVSSCNSGSVGCPSSKAKDYIYNIMAKGYDSLDDWCMSQAQQSIHQKMRNVGSWTAMIIAQPDGDLMLNSDSFSSKGQNRINLYSALWLNPGGVQYVPPNSTTVFSLQNNQMYNKHGTQATNISNALNQNITQDWVYGWSGIERNFTHAILGKSNYFVACRATTEACNGSSKYPCGSYGQCGGIGGSSCLFLDSGVCHSSYNCLVQGFQSLDLSNLVTHQRSANNNNSWASYANTSGGLMFGVPSQSCATNGFDFGVDYSGQQHINSGSEQQNSVICIANTSD